MRNPPQREIPTRLTTNQFDNCWKTAELFLIKNGKIRNRDLRGITGIGYDQAIDFFHRATGEDRLLRQGAGSGTHYVLKKG